MKIMSAMSAKSILMRMRWRVLWRTVSMTVPITGWAMNT